jgi:hypothetical protein
MDKLTELFNEYTKKNPNATELQLFQAGLTAGAVSMRVRALSECDKSTSPVGKVNINDLKNAIGQLSDIPS